MSKKAAVFNFVIFPYKFINLIKGSYQDEPDYFFKAVNRFDIAKRIVSKAGLAKAGMKLKHEAFIELNSRLVNYFYKNFKVYSPYSTFKKNNS